MNTLIIAALLGTAAAKHAGIWEHLFGVAEKAVDDVVATLPNFASQPTSTTSCAMNRDGSYYANTSTIIDLGDGARYYPGFFGADASSSKYVMALGGSCIEDSKFGWFLRPTEGHHVTLTATVWCAETGRCRDYTVPASAHTPDICVGGSDSMWPEFIESDRIDAMLTTNVYTNVNHTSFIAVNRLTNMPLYAGHHRSSDGTGAPIFRFREMRALGAGRPSPAAGEDDESWGITFFRNATGTPPPSSLFSVPDFCDDVTSPRTTRLRRES